MTEAQHQKIIMKWTQSENVLSKYPELKLLHHIPNGGSRNIIEAKHLKEQGVKSGVPDLMLPVARGGYYGLYIELKTEKGKISSSQFWWHKQLREQGYQVSVCYGFKEAIQCLTEYLETFPTD